VVNEALEAIVRVAASEQFAVIAYCFMPDHLHLLVEGETDGSNLITFAHQVKQHTEFSYRRRSRRRLWQRGYYEHAVRNHEATLAVARYILANPVRAGLVLEPRDYPFSGSLILDRRQLEDLWIVSGAS
jgi:putative transposase